MSDSPERPPPIADAKLQALIATSEALLQRLNERAFADSQIHDTARRAITSSLALLRSIQDADNETAGS